MRSPEKIIDRITLADKILLVVILIISVSGFAFIKKAFPHGTDVSIEANGKLIYRIPLDSNASIPVMGRLGETVVEIKDSKVHIKDSPCPNKICVHNGWIDRGAIVCLPNRVVVFISSPEQKKNKTVDAISG